MFVCPSFHSFVPFRSSVCVFWSPSAPSQTATAEAKPRYVYLISKPHGQIYRQPVRLLLSKAKLSYVYSILKPHGQSFITSPESVKSSCVRQHTQDVPTQRVHPNSNLYENKHLLTIFDYLFKAKKIKNSSKKLSSNKMYLSRKYNKFKNFMVSYEDKKYSTLNIQF